MRSLRGCLMVASVFPMFVTSAAAGAPGSGDDRRFDRSRFSDPVAIDNQWLPFVPGTQFVLEGGVTDSEGTTPHRVVLTVTDVTKVIDGVSTLVLWDRDFSDGELEEEEIAFEAQDDNGTVWNLGEYPEEHEDGKFIGAPSTWISGQAGAQAGIAMLARPEVGTPDYRQGYAPEIDFEDRGRVDKAHQKTCVPVACYQDVLVIDEWDPLDQPADGHQLKYHAPGVGTVRVEARGGEEQENLKLVKLRRLSAGELAKARNRVLELDRRAYKFAKDVYGGTPPAEPLGGAGKKTS
jgi:hypothetical protein